MSEAESFDAVQLPDGDEPLLWMLGDGQARIGPYCCTEGYGVSITRVFSALNIGDRCPDDGVGGPPDLLILSSKSESLTVLINALTVARDDMAEMEGHE